jgi:hypothetical protein
LINQGNAAVLTLSHGVYSLDDKGCRESSHYYTYSEQSLTYVGPADAGASEAIPCPPPYQEALAIYNHLMEPSASWSITSSTSPILTLRKGDGSTFVFEEFRQ